jgi:hypothetical protein
MISEAGLPRRGGRDLPGRDRRPGGPPFGVRPLPSVIRHPTGITRRSRASSLRSLRRVNSCSQIRITRHPLARSNRPTRRSRSRLRPIFRRQNAALVLGWVKCGVRAFYLCSFTEFPAVLDRDGTVRPDCDGQDKIIGGDCVIKVSLSLEKLLEKGDLVVSDFALGLKFSRIDHRQSISVVPCRHRALTKSVDENCVR